MLLSKQALCTGEGHDPQSAFGLEVVVIATKQWHRAPSQPLPGVAQAGREESCVRISCTHYGSLMNSGEHPSKRTLAPEWGGNTPAVEL